MKGRAWTSWRDQLHDGRRIRVLTIVDQHTRKAMAPELHGPTAQRLGYVDTRGVRFIQSEVRGRVYYLENQIISD